MDIIIFGGFVRAVQAIILSAPTLLVGLFIAAVFRYYLQAEGMRRLFGGDSIRSLPQSWLIGMLLPVCSIGVLPVLREMHRAKIRAGAMTAFALSAPLFNPLSLLYGLTLSRSSVILGFIAGSLVVVTVLGLIWDRFADKTRNADVDQIDTERSLKMSGMSRLAACFFMMSRELFGATGVLVIVASLGLWILGSWLPHGALQTSVEQLDPRAPLLMAAVAVPVYSTPMLIMSQLGMMFAHGNSPGAAFCLLILGAGMNLATIVWFARNYGVKGTSLWLVTLFTVVLASAYAIDRPLIPKGVVPAGHTHAFDVYTNPLHVGQIVSSDLLLALIADANSVATRFSLQFLGVLLVVGVVLRAAFSEKWTEETLVALSSKRAQNRGLGRVVSARIVGLTCLLGIVVLSVVGCFAYYPGPEEVLEEMQMAKGEVLGAALTGEAEAALHWIPIWEEWSRKLEVGTFLRRFKLRPYQQMQTHLLRKQLELLEHELEHQLEDGGKNHDDHHHDHDHTHPAEDEHDQELKTLIHLLGQTSRRIGTAYRN